MQYYGYLDAYCIQYVMFDSSSSLVLVIQILSNILSIVRGCIDTESLQLASWRRDVQDCWQKLYQT